MKYSLAVCGGTFDHFHKGHRQFLRYAISLSRRLLIGLTTQKYVKENNKGQGIASYQIRKQGLEEFLGKEKARVKVSIAPIDDIFIPKLWEHLPIEVIVVSENTLSGANEVNLKRKEQGKSPLKIEIYPMVKIEDNEYISSSKIRKGSIDKEGMSYVKSKWLQNKLYLTEKIRIKLKKPLGALVHDSPFKKRFKINVFFIITVGDVTTKAFNQLSIGQHISVVDFKVSRIKKFENLKELGFSGKEKIFKVKNPAGCLTPILFKTISDIFKLEKTNQRIVLQIEGEEDLSVLPLILAAPLGSIIFYGQPNEGVVKIDVSEKTKEATHNLLTQFRVGTRGH